MEAMIGVNVAIYCEPHLGGESGYYADMYDNVWSDKPGCTTFWYHWRHKYPKIFFLERNVSGS